MLNVYVPRPRSELAEVVWAGSGMVGSPAGSSGRIRVDYEGDQDLYPRYAERVRRAADRHRWSDGHRKGYPTRAAAHVEEQEVVAVGRYYEEERRVIVDDEEVLKAWLDVEELPELELQAEG